MQEQVLQGFLKVKLETYRRVFPGEMIFLELIDEAMDPQRVAERIDQAIAELIPIQPDDELYLGSFYSDFRCDASE